MTAAGAPTVDPTVLTAIGAAVRAREVLRFRYVPAAAGGDATAAADDSPTRRVEPHHLVASTGRWYLVGWDLDRDDWRVFRADRVRPRTPGGPRFGPRDVPGGDVETFVAARFRGAATTDGAWPCRGTLVLDADARDVAPFLTDGVVVDMGAGRCRVTLGSWSWVGVAASAARFDAAILHVEPQELADACAALADRFAHAAAASGRPRSSA